MALVTKTAQSIFAPATDSGTPRRPSLQEMQVWGTEVEQGVQAAALGLVRATSVAGLGAGARTGQPGQVTAGGDKGEYYWNGSSWVRTGDLIDATVVAATQAAVSASVMQLADFVGTTFADPGANVSLPSEVLPVVVGDDGNIVVGVTTSPLGPMGKSPIVSSMRLKDEMGLYTLQTDNFSDNWLFAVVDLSGFVVAGVRCDGSYLTQGNGTFEDVQWPAYCVYVEAGADLSKEMILSWHGLDGAPVAAEYRVLGASSWMSVGATAKDFPLRSEKIFSARIAGLSADTAYEARPAGSGAGGVRVFRTAPDDMERPLRVIFVSDPHLYVEVTDLTAWNALNVQIQNDEPDLVVIGGDIIIDNGYPVASRSERWARFARDMDRVLRRADGSQIPTLAFSGNHDAGNDGGVGGGGAYDGAGPYGYIDKIYSQLFRPVWDNVGGAGYGYVTIGKNVLLVFLDTNHGQPLADQIPWLEGLLSEKAGAFQHVICAGHMPPFPSVEANWGTDSAGPADRILRRQVLPILQQYPNCKFHLCGHNHVLFASPKIKMDPDETGDENRWYADPDGIRVLGAGGWASPSHEFDSAARISDIDGSSFIAAALSTDGVVVGVTPISTPTNTSSDPSPKHYWRIDFDKGHVTASAINVSGGAYITFTEEV